jgi:threonine/homoserine/homoserine lactone efflux protein
MVNELIAFIMASAISAWGSLQLGVVNVQVVRESLLGNRKGALLMALGGVVPEIPYSAAAFFLVNWLNQYPDAMRIASFVVVAVLTSLGLYYIIWAEPVHLQESETHGSLHSNRPFFRGLFLASLNPQLIFFWSGILFLIQTGVLSPQGLFPSFSLESGSLISPQYTFILGTACGAYFVLAVYAYLASRFKKKLAKWISFNFNYFTGGIFVLIAVLELIRNLSTAP